MGGLTREGIKGGREKRVKHDVTNTIVRTALRNNGARDVSDEDKV